MISNDYEMRDKPHCKGYLFVFIVVLEPRPIVERGVFKMVEPVRIELTSEKDPSPQSTGLSTALLIE
jgi:hypothetical protein